MPLHEDEIELAASVDGLARSRFWLEMTKLCDELGNLPMDSIAPRELSGIILKLANEVLLRPHQTRPEGPLHTLSIETGRMSDTKSKEYCFKPVDLGPDMSPARCLRERPCKIHESSDLPQMPLPKS